MSCKIIFCRKPVESSENGALYCKDHGCAMCFKHKGTQVLSDGTKICEDKKGTDCKERYRLKKLEALSRRELRPKQQELSMELENEIRRVSPDFCQQIKLALDKIAESKISYIDDRSYNIDGFINSIKTVIYSNCPSLDRDAKIKWKGIYENSQEHFEIVGFDYLPILYNEEKILLLDLAQKYQTEQNQQRGREEERKKRLLIQEIENELANSPSVNINEIPNQFHNYQNFTLVELEAQRDNMLTAIKNARADKELLDLLSRAQNSSDTDLWSFIQSFEELKGDNVSPAKKNAYQTYQNQVEAILNQLRKRWNNLSEEVKLTSYWNNAAFKFINWLKEAENLNLASDDPFANFIVDIKQQRTISDIDNKTEEARKHILNKFKQAVKSSLGNEQKTNEYYQIDQATDFEAVKRARDNIKLSRVNHHSPNSPSENPPLPAPDRKDDNQSPENDDLPSDLSSLDLDTIKQKIKAKIENLLKRSGKKLTPELYRDLCHGKECWKQYLQNNLSSKEEVVNFGQEMENLISNQANPESPEKNNNQTKNPASKNNLFSLSNILIASTGVIILSFGVAVIIAKKKKKHIK